MRQRLRNESRGSDESSAPVSFDKFNQPSISLRQRGGEDMVVLAMVLQGWLTCVYPEPVESENRVIAELRALSSLPLSLRHLDESII